MECDDGAVRHTAWATALGILLTHTHRHGNAHGDVDRDFFADAYVHDFKSYSLADAHTITQSNTLTDGDLDNDNKAECERVTLPHPICI